LYALCADRPSQERKMFDNYYYFLRSSFILVVSFLIRKN
jgi:hypothetical protein